MIISTGKKIEHKLYNASKYSDNSTFIQLYSYASHLHRQYIEHKIMPGDLYNEDSLFNVLTRMLVWNNFHTFHAANTRYYVNPYTLKLDVISTDASRPNPMTLESLLATSWQSKYMMLVTRDDAVQKLNAELDKMEEILVTVPIESKRLCRYVDVSNKECPTVRAEDIQDRIDFIRQNLDEIIAKKKRKYELHGLYRYFRRMKKLLTAYSLPLRNDVNYPAHIYAQYFDNGVLRVHNYLPHSIILKSAVLKTKGCKKCILHNLLFSPIRINPSTTDGQLPYYSDIPLELPVTNFRDKKLILTTKLGNKKKIFTISIMRPTDIYNPLLDSEPFEKQIEGLSFITESGNQVRIKSGSWEIASPLVLPVGAKLIIEEGTTLSFSPDAYMIVRGPVNFNGTEKAPIKLIVSQSSSFRPLRKLNTYLKSAHNNEKNTASISSHWKGLYVMDAKEQSSLKNVIFDHTSFLKDGVLQLTGGVTFYKSQVIFKNVKFNNSIAEDALNIVHSNFEFENVSFHNTRSDAFDADYSNGVISNASFSQIKGDGLDTSGSTINADQLKFTDIIDKSVSAGEESNLNIGTVTIDKSGAGVVVKDSSIVNIKNLKGKNIQLFIGMAFNKKNIFAGGKLNVQQSNFGPEAFMAQHGSEIALSDKILLTHELDVNNLYNSGPMKKIR